MGNTGKALIIVDAQYDFIEGGALAVAGGEAALKRLNEYLSDAANVGKYDLIVTTQDWHNDPGEHWVEPGAQPDFDVSWPVHCAAGTGGALIYGPLVSTLAQLQQSGVRVVQVRKGYSEAAYSGFEGRVTSPSDGDGAPTGGTLTEALKSVDVTAVDVVGVAYDYCVKATAVDAYREGFEVTVLQEFTAAVRADRSSMRKTTDVIEQSGVVVARFDETLYPTFYPAVDLAVFTLKDGELVVLMVERGNAPCQGMWALPGGFVNPDEDLETAALRELSEETGMVGDRGWLEQQRTYYHPGRDPRMNVVSVAYVAVIPEATVVAGGDDARNAEWVPVSHVLDGTVRVAFDHGTILRDSLERVRGKLEYTTVASMFLDEQFTLGDLRRVYEKVWGRKLHPSNFRRKVLSSAGFVVPVDATVKGDSSTGGNRAALYVAGDAKLLHPAILNVPDGE